LISHSRQAVAEFTPLRPQKFQDLIPAKDVIIELRHGASFGRLPLLLTAHCPDEQDSIATSAIRFLRDCPATPRPGRMPGSLEQMAEWFTRLKRRPGEFVWGKNHRRTQMARIPQIAQPCGPRIAQVRILN